MDRFLTTGGPNKTNKQKNPNKSVGSKINFKLLSFINFQIFQKQKKKQLFNFRWFSNWKEEILRLNHKTYSEIKHSVIFNFQMGQFPKMVQELDKTFPKTEESILLIQRTTL